MRNRFRDLVVAIIAAVATGFVLLSLPQTSGQSAQRGRTADGKPDLSGIWQANNEANWDLEPHAALPGMVTQRGVYPYDYARVPAAPVLALGAVGAVRGSLGVVEGGRIPYKPEALAKKKQNLEHWLERDPEVKCFLPGIPRAMYMPYPFRIVQGTNKVQMAFEYTSSTRTVHLDEVDDPPDDSWMGHAVGRWEGDTLVIDSSHFNDQSWFDRAGNFHSDKLHLIERLTPISADAIQYDVTIEDPEVFTGPWKISMPLYRRLDTNMQLLEFRCQEFVEELAFGHLRKNQLVNGWSSDTMDITIKRKIPAGDKLYER